MDFNDIMNFNDSGIIFTYPYPTPYTEERDRIKREALEDLKNMADKLAPKSGGLPFPSVKSTMDLLYGKKEYSLLKKSEE